jgi:lauroyl/myristoyl acyltransferase
MLLKQAAAVCRDNPEDTKANMALTSTFKLAGAWIGFYLLRVAERLLPPSVLSFLLWPLTALRDLLHVRQRRLFDCWRRFPEAWRPNPFRFFLRQSLALTHPQPLYIWPDRLAEDRWLRRCHLLGRRHLIRAGERPVVFASLHFGPFELLPYWLRAHGVAVTMIRGSTPGGLKRLTTYQHALSPPSDVPLFLDLNRMTPLPRFTNVRQLLAPGRRLLVTVDVDRGIQFQLPFEDRIFRMATGAIRLAAMAGAELIPCLIAETSTWQFALHLGEPVPQRHLGDSPDLEAIGLHLLGEFSKVISSYPEQCRSRLLAAISPVSQEKSETNSESISAAEGFGVSRT